MKFYLILIFLLLVFSACKEEKDSAVCNSDNPLEMQWMADWVGELQHCVCTISIFQADFNGQTVFWTLMNDPLCQSVINNISVYNCIGEEILVLDNYEDLSAFNEQATALKIIYVCPKN